MDFVAEDPDRYLASDPVIETEAVTELADSLVVAASDDLDYAQRAYVWVRDEIAHSLDVGDRRVVITASQVLSERVGLCFAKSHLLAALLRAQGIPVGLCYQRLRDDDGLALHGLVAVHLNDDWHRLDPRGNKPGVDAQFSVGTEKLAWSVDPRAGEADLPEIHRSTPTEILAVLEQGNLRVPA